MRKTGRVTPTRAASTGQRSTAAPTATRLPNSAVRRLAIQRQLQVGAANDPAEREADRMASHVMREIGRPAEPQRQPEEEELQMKHDPFVRRQDLEEEEELQMKQDPFVRRQDLEEEELQMKHDPFAVRRDAIDEEELMAKHQESATIGMEGGPVDSQTSAAISSARGGGQPLDAGIRGPMESAFNADLSGVNVHTDSRSDDLNTTLQAKAFTVGNDIFFRSGDYQPTSRSGQELLAHELTHVIQQGGG